MASFDKRVKQIASAEKDVDKVLKAARLKRIENGETTGSVFLKAIAILSVTVFSIFGILYTGVVGFLMELMIFSIVFAMWFCERS